MTERPILTTSFLTLLSLGVLLYTFFFLSPERLIHLGLFLLNLQIFLTGLITLLTRLVARVLRRPGPLRLRKALLFNFVLSLWFSLYLGLKALGVATLLNLYLLTTLILVSLLAILKNDQ